MYLSSDSEGAGARAWFETLRDRIRGAFEALEDVYGGASRDRPPGRFERKAWEREGGGGEMSIMRGRVFEKVGVNVSTVPGEFSEEFRDRSPSLRAPDIYW